MAEPDTATLAAAPLPSSDDLERAEAFTREPFLLEGEVAAALAPGHPAPARARRGARRELDGGAKVPSVEWRRQWSLLLGLERLLSPGRAHARRRHGALRPPGRRALGHADRAAGRGPARRQRQRPRERRRLRRAAHARVIGDPGRGGDRRGGEDEPDEEPQDWEDEDARGRGRRGHRGARGPQRRQALLVRARDRRRQDRRRARLRRGLAHRRHPDPHPPPQPRRPVPRRAARPRLRQADLARRCSTARTTPNGPVTVETYQWFVRNAGKISDAYTIVICDEAHTALGEKTSAAIRSWAGPIFIGMTATGALIARHVTDLFPTQTSRFDLAQAARRGVIAPLRCIRIPPGPGRAHDRQGAAAPRRGRHRVRPGDAGRAARPDAVQPGDRRPLQDALQRRARRRLRRRRAPRLQRRRGVPRRRA